MWFRLRLDIGYLELVGTVVRCLFSRDRAGAERRLLEVWPGPHHTGCFLSVRSGFDLLLDALDLPAGSEVMMSALTIPDMVEVVLAHDLVPVPVDVVPETGRVDEDALCDAITPRSKILLIAQLFGDVAPLDGVIERIADRGILLIEDSAQAFSGLRGFTGHEEADVSMFSFGPIKTATALGGAIFNIRDADLLRRMRERAQQWPVQSSLQYLRRVMVYGFITLTTGPRAYAFLSRAARWFGRDLDALLVRASRSFGRESLLQKIRRRPSTALLSFLGKRLVRYDQSSVSRRQKNGERLVTRLEPVREHLLASRDAPRSHAHAWWLFPVLVDRPEDLQRHLRAEGFDTSAGHSLGTVPARAPGRTTGAENLLEHVVFVPVYGSIPEAEIDRLAQAILASLTIAEK